MAPGCVSGAFQRWCRRSYSDRRELIFRVSALNVVLCRDLTGQRERRMTREVVGSTEAGVLLGAVVVGPELRTDHNGGITF